MKFRKKPVEVDAVQWFANGHVPLWAQHAVKEFGDHFVVHTLNGPVRGVPGEWIVRGVQGEIYPCNPDIFAATDDAVDEANKPWRVIGL